MRRNGSTLTSSETSTFKRYDLGTKRREFAEPPLKLEGARTQIWYEAPVAVKTTEEGRAKNRRVWGASAPGNRLNLQYFLYRLLPNAWQVGFAPDVLVDWRWK